MATATGTYTIAFTDQGVLIACVPDDQDIDAQVRKFAEDSGEEPVDYDVDCGLILTDEVEAGDDVRFNGFRMGCLGDVNNRIYEYAVRRPA